MGALISFNRLSIMGTMCKEEEEEAHSDDMIFVVESFLDFQGTVIQSIHFSNIFYNFDVSYHVH